MTAGEESGDEGACFSIVRFSGGTGLRCCDGVGEPVVRGEPLRFCDVTTRAGSVEPLRRMKLVESGSVIVREQQLAEIEVGRGVVGRELGEMPICGLGIR